jgi:hypothetical protein
VNWDDVLNEVEDYLFPKMELSHRERSLYYHVLLHTRFAGKDSGLFSLPPLSTALGIAERSIREGLRILQDKGCIRIEEISRQGHLVRAFLPSEIEGLIPAEGSPNNTVLDLPEDISRDAADFEKPIELEATREEEPLPPPPQPVKKQAAKPTPAPKTQGNLNSLLEREDGHCFFCLRRLPPGVYKQALATQGSGTQAAQENVVVACQECASQKQGVTDENFLRQLYRKGFLSAGELEERLQVLVSLQSVKVR